MELGLLLLVPLGFVCGIIASTAGATSLLSFPILLAAGYSPLQANVTNTVGIVMPTTLGGSLGYRDRLKDEGHNALVLAAVGGLGGGLGGGLLLLLGERVFEAVVPALLICAAALVLVGPWIVRRISRARELPDRRCSATVSTFLFAIYGGYFGAGVGPLLVGTYVLALRGGIQRANALKVLVVLATNSTATILFVIFAPVDWSAALALTVSSVAGGYAGAHTARRMPEQLLRGAIAFGALASAIMQLT
jgi:uncharacterized membrane protein YfcA